MIQILKLSARAIMKNTKTTVLQYILWLSSMIQILKPSARAILKNRNTTSAVQSVFARSVRQEQRLEYGRNLQFCHKAP